MEDIIFSLITQFLIIVLEEPLQHEVSEHCEFESIKIYVYNEDRVHHDLNKILTTMI